MIEGIKLLASAVLSRAVDDYRFGDRRQRLQIRSEMERNSFWLDILDLDMDFEQIANIIEKQEREGIKIERYTWCI